MNARLLVTAVVGLAISALAIWWTVTHVDLSLVFSAMRSVLGPGLLVLAAAQVANLGLKAWRWNRILKPVHPLTMGQTWNLLVIGFMGNNVLPARFGEVLRMGFLERRYGFSLAQAAGTIVVERYLDILLVLAQFGVATLFVPIPPTLRQGAATVLLASVVLGGIILVLALGGPQAADGLEARLPGRAGSIVGGLVRRLAEGMAVLRQGDLLGTIVVLSVCIWTLEVVTNCFVMRLFGLPATLAWAGFYVGVSAMSLLIPGGPGNIGSMQALAAQVLGVFGVPAVIAVSVSLTAWFMQFLLTVTFGLIACVIETRRVREN